MQTAASAYIRDTLGLVGGKWKLHITHALAGGPLRFKELQREIGDITSRMLSKELKELEMNELISREVYATAPVTVEYSFNRIWQDFETCCVSPSVLIIK